MTLQSNRPIPQTRRLLPWVWYFARPHRWALGGYLLNRIARTAMVAFQPYCITKIVGIYTAPVVDHALGWKWIVGSLGSFFASTWMVTICGYERTVVDAIRRRATVEAFAKYMRMPLAWHEQEGSGARLQRMLTGVEGLERMLQIIFWPTSYLMGTLLGTFVTLVVAGQPLLIPWFAGFCGCYIGLSIFLSQRRARLFAEYFQDREAAVKNLFDFSTSAATVKTYNLSEFLQERVTKAESRSHGMMCRLWRLYYWQWVWLNHTGLFFFIGTFLWLLHMANLGHIAIPILVTLTWLFYQAWNLLDESVDVQADWIKSAAALQRLSEDLRQEESTLDFTPVQALSPFWRTVHFENVSYRYPTRSEDSLENIALTIERGKKTALAGHSGAGKTTVIKLLTKLMLPTEGKITIDGIDLSHISGDAWRSQLAVVPQEVEMLNTTIRDNVLLDKVDITEEKLWEALELAQAAEFIRALPQGVDTAIGERGVKLSGGQKQRIGIARALVRGAEVIIFDEATSQLDAESEHALQRALATAFGGKTLVLIAHRLATIRQADNIIVLEEGRLAEQGALPELLKRDGRFAEFWALQVGV